MPIRFKCEHCKKPLSVKETLAGKRANCPACQKPIVIPAPMSAPADLEDFAASALADPEAPKDDATTKPIDFTCSMCGEEVQFPFDMAGKQAPCPLCKRIIKVPLPKIEKPKDWRELDKKGPAAALINQPEQLDGAWGTEVKGKVSETALREAEVITDHIKVEPVGLRGWIRRALGAAALVGFFAVLYYGARFNVQTKQHKDAIAAALALLKDDEAEKDPKKKLSPILIAEIHRADGAMKLRLGKTAESVRQAFFKARAVILGSKETGIDRDLFLIDLAHSQLDMAGSEDEIRTKKRYEYGVEVHKEVIDTLKQIKTNEAKVIAVRELAAALKERGQVGLGVTFASAGAESTRPQLNALMVAFGDVKKVAPPIPPMDPKKPTGDGQAVIAYAEAAAWKGPEQLETARELMQINANPLIRLEAALGVCSILFLTRPEHEVASMAAPALAAPFVPIAFTEIERLRTPSELHRVQLLRVACRTEHAELARKKIMEPKAVLELPGPAKRRAQLELLRIQLEKAGSAASMDLKSALPDKEGPCRGLGWIMLARHLTRHGAKVDLPEGDDAPLLPFANIGVALGNQDRQR